MGAVVIEEQDVQDDAATDTNGNGTPKARRKQVPKAPTFLSSLDLTTAPVSLQHFCNREESHGAERQVPRSGHMVQGADEDGRDQHRSHLHCGRKRVLLIAASILAARKLAQYGSEAQVPATISAIADAIRWAERIMQEIDRRWPIKGD